MSSNRIISKEATVNGVRIYCRIAGSGSPLILLHGSPLTSRSWLRLMPTLAKTYTVIAPDFRGYGQSDKPETGYEVQTMVEDLRQLLDQLGIKSGNTTVKHSTKKIWMSTPITSLHQAVCGACWVSTGRLLPKHRTSFSLRRQS